MITDSTLIRRLENALPNYIGGRRWFRSKTLTIGRVEVSHIIEADGFLILFLTVHYAEGGNDLYLLPITSVLSPNAEESKEQAITSFVSLQGENVFVYEAVFSPLFRTFLFRALAGSARFEAAGVSLSGQSVIHLPAFEGIRESFVSKAEQSNTSIIFGQEFILKLFRKLESGINPDIEIGAFLTEQGFPNTPAVLATLQFQVNQGEAYSAGILQRFVPNMGDAWKYTLQSLEAVGRDSQNIGDYAASAKLLGVRTAQMHAALSSSTTNPEFAPESFTLMDSQTLSREIAAQAEASIELLRAKLLSLAPAEQTLAQQVVNLKPKIVQRFSALAAITTSAKRIRYHGDYHLGQVLYTGSDFMIIDFEGEPARPLSERRSKGLALRDVAGMLRSFQYAAYAALKDSNGLADYWYSQVSKLFLAAYYGEAGGRSFLPSTPEQRNFILEAFILQKAFYEVQYELNNRPGWVGIPLRGIISLIET